MLRKSTQFLAAAILSLGVLLTGCQTTTNTSPPVVSVPVDLDTLLTSAFGPIDQKVAAGDGYLALSPADGTTRTLAYLLPDRDRWTVAGTPVRLPDAETVRLEHRPYHALLVLETAKEGAPQYTAYQYDQAGLHPVDYYGSIAPEPPVKEGPFILVNKHLNVLWHYENGALVSAYRVATGRLTVPPATPWQEYSTGDFTPEGRYQLTNFVADEAAGSRWMGFTVLNGDNAWLWGIRTTSDPESIGTWSTDGTIGMRAPDAAELFSQIDSGRPPLMVVRR